MILCSEEDACFFNFLFGGLVVVDMVSGSNALAAVAEGGRCVVVVVVVGTCSLVRECN